MTTGVITAARAVDNPDELALIADPWTVLSKPDADRFRAACREAADRDDGHGIGYVDPNLARELLMVDGVLSIDVRQYSALWSAACNRNGYLATTQRRVPIVGDGSRNNHNKDVRIRVWINHPALTDPDTQPAQPTQTAAPEESV